VRFYEQAFGARQYFRDAGSAQVLGPDPTDVIAFELAPAEAVTAGGLMHFGLRLTGADELDGVLAQVLAAGGTLKRIRHERPTFRSRAGGAMMAPSLR
jgi:hypothetical protein